MVSTSLYDASLIATPATGSPPTGTWALSLSTAQQTQAACLTGQGQQAAWNCDLAGQPALAISVGPPPGPNPTNGAFLFYASDETEVSYGPQYQFMNTDFAPFMTVQDNDDPENGPAYYFQKTYNKIVVVPEQTFQPTSNKEKRQFEVPQGWMQQKQVIQPGEKPWFCVFNNTFLEAFIYVQQPTTTSYSNTSTTHAPTSSASDAAVSAAAATSASSISGGESWANSEWRKTATISRTVTNPTTTATYVGAATAIHSWEDGHGFHYDDDNDDDNHSKRKRWNEQAYSQLQTYPYLVKIEERRLPNNPTQPYCQKYQILDDGTYNWVADETGDSIIVNLQEDDPDYSEYQSAGIAGSKDKRQNVPGGCHCQWMSGQ